MKREYPKAVKEFNEAYEGLDKATDEATEKINQNIDRMEANFDQSSQAIDRMNASIDRTFQRATQSSQAAVRDYWVNSEESANYGKNLSPEESEAAERYLQQLMKLGEEQSEEGHRMGR